MYPPPPARIPPPALPSPVVAGRVGGPEWQAVMQSRLNSVARGRIIRIEEQPDQSGSGTRFMVVLSTK